MPGYFFNLYECGKLILTDESCDLPDMGAVHSRAVKEAREIMAAEVQKGELCLSCRMEVLDEELRPVLILPFKEALKLTGL
jgi:hypothetical protein